ncbi:MAG TPA: hypothetical protein VE955_10180, partial [Candidatus Dormibacteraeota bacterium]|nr:hypothetical protein [Candidatus Dormibacteraeota bacterium]
PPTLPKVTLKGLSLSLLHFTFAISSEGYAVRLNGSSVDYDSQTSQTSSGINVAQVIVPDSPAYEFRFNDNYTLLTNPPVSLRAVYEAAAANSLPSGAFQGQGSADLIRVQDYVRAALPSIAGLPSSSEMNLNTSKLIYRISYPTWGGIGIKHDPTYVAYYVPHLILVSLPVSDPTIIYLAVGVAAVAVTAILAIKRTRRIRTQSENGRGSRA